MKVERKEGFRNVVITLESQEEVDVLFAVCNYVPINEYDDIIKRLYLQLPKSDYLKHHDRLEAALIKFIEERS